MVRIKPPAAAVRPAGGDGASPAPAAPVPSADARDTPSESSGNTAEMSHEEMVKRYDKDGDGKLSSSEYRARFDKDGDGNLNTDEYNAYRSWMRQQYSRGSSSKSSRSGSDGSRDERSPR